MKSVCKPGSLTVAGTVTKALTDQDHLIENITIIGAASQYDVGGSQSGFFHHNLPAGTENQSISSKFKKNSSNFKDKSEV